MSKKSKHSQEAHPWFTFLRARANCIHDFHEQGKTDEEIAKDLSLEDAAHVRAIRMATAYEEPGHE